MESFSRFLSSFGYFRGDKVNVIFLLFFVPSPFLLAHPRTTKAAKKGKALDREPFGLTSVKY